MSGMFGKAASACVLLLSRHVYPYYSGLEGHGLGGLKLKTQRNTHAATKFLS